MGAACQWRHRCCVQPLDNLGLTPECRPLVEHEWNGSCQSEFRVTLGYRLRPMPLDCNRNFVFAIVMHRSRDIVIDGKLATEWHRKPPT